MEKSAQENKIIKKNQIVTSFQVLDPDPPTIYVSGSRRAKIYGSNWIRIQMHNTG